MTEKFWLHDISILFNKNTFTRFVPSEDQTLNEKFNCVTRFCIYFIILILLTTKNLVWISLSISIIIFIIYLQKVEHFKETSKPPKCFEPTHNNPFMNYTMGDHIENPNRSQACDITNDDIKTKAKKYFNHNLYRNSFDTFDREINIRPWITMPVTEVVNKQSEFGEWLYGNTSQCKSAGINCLKNRDMRYHKM
jgi:hypothetical protein